MRAKGYTEKDVIQEEVQKAYAEGIGNMNISGGGGGVATDMIGLCVGMTAAGAVSGQMAKCAKYDAELSSGAKFCLECGKNIRKENKNEKG